MTWGLFIAGAMTLFTGTVGVEVRSKPLELLASVSIAVTGAIMMVAALVLRGA